MSEVNKLEDLKFLLTDRIDILNGYCVMSEKEQIEYNILKNILRYLSDEIIINIEEVKAARKLRMG